MTTSITIGPRYGRDYKSAKEATADFLANKDFTSYGMASYGAAINLTDCHSHKIDQVTLRFKGLTQSTIIKVPTV